MSWASTRGRQGAEYDRADRSFDGVAIPQAEHDSVLTRIAQRNVNLFTVTSAVSWLLTNSALLYAGLNETISLRVRVPRLANFLDGQTP